MSWPAAASYGSSSAMSGPAPSVGMQEDGKAKRSSLATLAEKLAAPAPKPTKLDKVKVDGMVLLKIIKHCTESVSEFVMGALLGLDVGDKLEVTNSFAFPQNKETERKDNDRDRYGDRDRDRENEEDAKAQSDYAMAYEADMLKHLKDINIDCNLVGWYRSANLGSFCGRNLNLVEQQFMYQEFLDHEGSEKSVLLVFDPKQTERGNLALKAYRLTEAFCNMHRQNKNSEEKGSPVILPSSVVAAVGGVPADGSAVASKSDSLLSSEEIFEELPIEICNAHLFTVLVDELKHRNGERLDVDFDRLNLSSSAYLSDNLEALEDLVQALKDKQRKVFQEKMQQQKNEQDMIKFIKMRRQENQVREERGEALLPEVESSNEIFRTRPVKEHLELLLLRKQIGMYTQQVNRFSGAGFSKLYLAGAIHGKKVA